MPEQLLGFVGDVLVDRDEPRDAFSDVREILAAPDVLFANLEGAYTDAPRPLPGILGPVGPAAHNLDVFSEVGFDVMSLANNHILDVGYEALSETRSRLHAKGVKTCGAGQCLTDARSPAIIEAGGLKIAFIAYASVFPCGYEAHEGKPGLAPMRAYNLWRDPYPTIHVPGKQPIVSTSPDPQDLANLAEDIAHARGSADIVVASFHWGDYMRRYHLTDHETRMARYCIDAGVDIVVGHHHHTLRGMEWYRGKPIMYGLGHFVFDLRFEWSEKFKKAVTRQLSTLSAEAPYTTAPREGWPLLPMHEDARMTALAWVSIEAGAVVSLGFLPCRLTADGLVHPLRLSSSESDAVVDYLQRCNETQQLNGRIEANRSFTLAGYDTLQVVPQ